MKKIFVFIILSLFFISVVSAGVINPYWESRPLEMNFGETKVVNFKITNPDGDELTYNVEIKNGADIASLKKTTYTITGTENTIVPLTITIPEDYGQQIRKVELLFTMVTPDQEGMITLTPGYISTFDVILSKEPTPARSTLTGIIVVLIIALIILTIVIFVLVKKKKR